MNKILVVINAHQPNMASIDFACSIAAMTKSKLTGLFIENLYFHHPAPDLDDAPYSQAVQTKTENVGVTTETDLAVKLFVQECALNNIQAETYIDSGEPIQQVIYESRFADLLIVDPKINFYDVDEQLPSHFTKEILANAECPVMLAPEKKGSIEAVVFCYDGTSSSVFALKQFTYLMTGMRNKKAMLLEVNKTGNEIFNEDHRRIMAWLRTHYSVVEYHALKGRAKDELFTYFFMKSGEVIVMGSYGRTALSNFFKHSAAETIIRTLDLPIFITHNKQ